MPQLLSRLTVGGSVLAALAVSSLCLAPAAQAATPHVSGGYTTQRELVPVASHRDRLTLTKASDSVIRVAAGIYVPSRYRLSLTSATGHLLLRKTVGAWQALNAFTESETRTYETDTVLVDHLNHETALAANAAKKSYNLILEKVAIELAIADGVSKEAEGMLAWIQEHPAATTFDTFFAEFPETHEFLSGAPRDFTMSYTDTYSGIGLSLRTYGHDEQQVSWHGPAVFGTFTQGGKVIALLRS